MAFYDQHPQHTRQPSWNANGHQAWPLEDSMRQEYNGTTNDSGASTAPTLEEDLAFRSQFEEVERAHDNLSKSARNHFLPMHSRRESLPLGGQFAGQFPLDRMGPPRHHPMNDYEGMRTSPSASGLQGYLANQRFGPPPRSEAESMLQQKRRAAAQREKELRNYHQEQQYNRTSERGVTTKSERAMSPNAMSENDRRELIARQHKALYGENSSIYDAQPPRPVSQDARVLAATSGTHSGSPLGGYEAFGHPPPTSSAGSAVPKSTSGLDSRSRSNSAAPKDSSTSSFSMFDTNRPSSSSPSDVPGNQHAAGPIGPIGSRGGQTSRKTPPMPSPLGLGAHSNGAPTSAAERHNSLSWGAGSGPWGPTSKNSLDQAPVWG